MNLTINVNTENENEENRLAEELIAQRMKECLEECFPPDTGVLVEVSSILKEVIIHEELLVNETVQGEA